MSNQKGMSEMKKQLERLEKEETKQCDLYGQMLKDAQLRLALIKQAIAALPVFGKKDGDK